MRGKAFGKASDPEILLLDEPFSVLDALTRDELSFELMQLWTARRSTAVFITHSITEAVLMADRIFVLAPRPGRLREIVPVELTRPRTLSTMRETLFHALSDHLREELLSCHEHHRSKRRQTRSARQAAPAVTEGPAARCRTSCRPASVGPGSTVYVAGAGPVGLAAAASARLLGAAVVIVGDVIAARLAHARDVGFHTVDLSLDATLAEQIEQILGVPEVDCAVDAVGFEARGHGHDGSRREAPATVLNSLMEVTRAAGKIGIPGLYVTDDPGASDAAAKRGALSIRLGLGWAKSHSFFTGQTPVMKYNRALMQAILWDRIRIADVVGVEVISLDDAPRGYAVFDSGAPKKFVIDPHSRFRQAA